MDKKIVCETLSSFVNEETWNYHFGNLPSVDNVTPYYSENKVMMSTRRDTGHFGSGMYFSTYKNDRDTVIDDNKFSGLKEPDLVQLNDRLYRVDIDSYNNLFKPETATDAEWLFRMLKALNEMYNIVVDNIKSGKSADYIEDNYEIVGYEYVETGEEDEDGWAVREKKPKYEKVISNMEILYKEYVTFNNKLRNWMHFDFKLLSYEEVCLLCKDLYQNKSMTKSLSTLYMEMNGYNGVNVSGIREFDNTTHGSVIYNMQKHD